MSLEAIRRGDHAALHSLLEAHGAAADLILEKLGAMERRAEIVVRVQRSAVGARRNTEPRSHLLATVAFEAAAPAAEPPGRHPALDARAALRLAAELAAGAGDELDQKILEQTLDHSSALRDRCREVQAAIEAARHVSGPSRALSALWARVESMLPTSAPRTSR